LKGRLKLRKFQSVDLEYELTDFCVLPNDKLVTANYYNNSLCIYDENFILIENITTINNSKIEPFSVTTNNIDRIYICDDTNILMTDLEFKFVSKFSDEVELKNPHYILFYNEFLYVCYLDNNCIVKFHFDLKINTKYYLEIKPYQMTIINNLACVVPSKDQEFFYFYDLVDFRVKYKYPRRKFTIIYDNNFFALNEEKIDSYDKTGTLLDSISLDCLKDDKLKLATCPVLAVSNNNKLFISLYKNKLFII
jgi:hypothetical protein